MALTTPNLLSIRLEMSGDATSPSKLPRLSRTSAAKSPQPQRNLETINGLNEVGEMEKKRISQGERM